MKKYNNIIKKLKNNQKGIALIEFAIILPVVVVLFLGCVDVVIYVVAHQKISRAAYTMSNLLTQMDQGLTESQVNDMILALNQVSNPYDIENNGKAVMTAIIGNGVDGSAPSTLSVAWKRCFGTVAGLGTYGAPGTTVSQSAIPVNTIVTTKQILIITEISYQYTPIISFLPLSGTISYRSFFRPRRGTIQNIIADGATPRVCV